MEEMPKKFKILFLMWLMLRKINSSDQFVPSFSGFGVQERSNIENISELQKTTLTYLLPINSSITSFDTIYKLFQYLQSHAKKSESPYVNLTLDAGAFVNAYRVLCNYPEMFSNVVLHLGDFHYMKELFGVVGKLVRGSGFEDIIFQAGICSTGSLNGVLSGSQYNRCWLVHSVMAEALERLCIESFIQRGHSVPDTVMQYYKTARRDLEALVEDQHMVEFLEEYEDFKENIRKGTFGKTARFWMTYYLDVVRNIHLIHYSVQTNDYNLRLKGFKEALPFYFALNKQNYARYGSIYVTRFRKPRSYSPRM